MGQLALWGLLVLQLPSQSPCPHCHCSTAVSSWRSEDTLTASSCNTRITPRTPHSPQQCLMRLQQPALLPTESPKTHQAPAALVFM
jgi:hypothetical protein